MSWVEKRLSDIAKVALVAMVLLITANVILRAVGARPINGVTEITSMYLMVGLTWLAIANTQREKRHIAADVLVQHLGLRTRSTIDTVVRLLCGAAALLIAWQGWKSGIDSWGEAITGAVNIPTAPPRLLFGLGLTLLGIRFLVDAVSSFRSILAPRTDPAGNDDPVHRSAPDSQGGAS